MDSSVKLSITDKGREELTSRTRSLNLKRRSLLILLSATPKTIDALFQINPLKREEFADILESLVNEGYIHASNPVALAALKPASEAPAVHETIDAGRAHTPNSQIDRSMIDVWKT